MFAIPFIIIFKIDIAVVELQRITFVQLVFASRCIFEFIHLVSLRVIQGVI